MFELLICTGKLKGRRLSLPDAEVIVGRSEKCAIRIPSTLVSRNHCALRKAADGIWVRDLGSQNGTYINDAVISDPVLLQHGDQLRVGALVFQMEQRGETVGEAATSPKSAKSKPGPTTESQIADWLTRVPVKSAPSDTTIIKRSMLPEVTSVTTAGAATTRPSKADLVRRAGEIIRRHWQAKRKHH